MNTELQILLVKIASTTDFWNVDFSDINATNYDGDNALHCVCVWGDSAAAKLLIDAGISINKYGDLGCTPLHIACSFGHSELVALLVENGANLFAMSEGETPFSKARVSGHDTICDYLLPFIKNGLAQNKHLYLKSRIQQLKEEVVRLESQLASRNNP